MNNSFKPMNTISKLFITIALLLGIQKTYASQSKPKFIVIQNVATERTRVYELCYATPGCPHRLVFETEMLVGKRGENEMRTLLGVYKITEWVKFYEDKNRNYPSWYDPNYPMPPSANDSASDWFDDEFMPGGRGEMRGAFGWFAALVEPNAFGQWMHGTIGWGANENEFIRRAKKGFLSVFVDLRSHGCTRHENRAIAYLQHLVPAGTPLIKVYAKEKLDDVTLTRYRTQQTHMTFNYILTRDEVRKSSPHSIDYHVVMAKIQVGQLSQNDVLEVGSYLADRYPSLVPIDESKSAKSGKSGDVYEVGKNNMQGTFSIDTGRLENYIHPKELQVGGDQTSLKLPDIVKK